MASREDSTKGAWKPCGSLTAADFEHHPVWGFDLDREVDGVGDEAWVRPYVFPRLPKHTDTLLRTGRKRPGAITFRFEAGKLDIDPGVVILEPRYCIISCDARGVVSEHDLPYVRKVVRNVESVFPIAYEGVVRVSGREFPPH